MIQEYKYGMFKIDNKMYYDDIKILGTKVKMWECRDRQVTLKDIEDVLAAKPQVVVIGLGAGGLIGIADEVKHALLMKRITLIADKNQQACEAYNRALADGSRVAAIFPGRG